MGRTHVMNTCVTRSTPGVGKEAEYLTETDGDSQLGGGSQVQLGVGCQGSWRWDIPAERCRTEETTLGQAGEEVPQVEGGEGADLRQEIKEWGKTASGLQG